MSDIDPAKSLAARDLRTMFRGRPLVIGTMEVSRLPDGAYHVIGTLIVNEDTTDRGFDYTISPDGQRILTRNIPQGPHDPTH